MYRHGGAYGYRNGLNSAAVIALLLGIVPNLPGFLLQIKVISPNLFPWWISDLYNYAWFVGFFVSGGVYLLLMKPVANYQKNKAQTDIVIIPQSTTNI